MNSIPDGTPNLWRSSSVPGQLFHLLSQHQLAQADVLVPPPQPNPGEKSSARPRTRGTSALSFVPGSIGVIQQQEEDCPMTTVAVFGGTGFLGRQVVRRLAANGATVRVAVRNPEQA